ncbi:MAG: thioredoxin domain-containing protein [Clostridia bacterium]|nr:thioredoxin domain-containing protein [Clostridia bacterium]MDD4386872.1 thioredoxin domain-containing protein [Clostridia bacterium]
MNYKYTNELINEKSPYLLQHAHNPVNWYPWSNIAFSKAIDENKPIFLSIGYSTCHWCHVMEKESFEDTQIATILNNDFISIKVDREERPDIDSIYMSACQSLTGNGGWPLTLFLDHYQRPFFAGTYFPKQSNFHQVGLIDILEKIKNTWTNDKEKVLDASKYITNTIRNTSNTSSSQNINSNIQDETFKIFLQLFDTTFGGFGSSTKFPNPNNLLFLLRYYHRSNDEKSLLMVNHTLECIYRGGIYDHIGFGFSRYSTDKKWLVPHFEKMLYDNALLSLVYIEAFQITKNELFSKVANDVLTYTIRDMMSQDGGFYSAEDADSEGIEGKFYVWSYNELINILGKNEGIKFCKQFNITKKGNFKGNNIPNLIGSENINVDDNILKKLFIYRNKRIHPHKDDKILTSWNGLMIVSLSIAGRILKNKKYIDCAKRTVTFIYNNLIDSDGRLLARYRDGHASILAYSDDYSFLIWGLIELYESTFDSIYLEKAIQLNDELIKYFWDEKSNGLFLYGSDSEKLIIRPKEVYDGVIPSANSVSALNWLKLSRLTSNPKLEELANKQFKTFSDNINSNPTSSTFMLCAYLFTSSITKEIIILGDTNNQRTKEMFDILNSKFDPNVTTIFKDTSDNSILKIIPHLSNYKEVENVTTAYVCSNNSCSLPIIALNKFKDIF